MDFLFFYINLIRILLVVITIVQLFKHDYKKVVPAVVTIVLTFVPWLLSRFHIQIDTLTEFLFLTVVFMAVCLGSGYRYYDRLSWWDRIIHFLSGIMFFGFGISLAGKSPNVGLAGTLLFSFTLSLALHEIWEVFEFIVDSLFRTDHQHWQKHSSVVNHQPDKAIQPPGLMDTMIDTIAGMIGAIAACAGWCFFLSV